MNNKVSKPYSIDGNGTNPMAAEQNAMDTGSYRFPAWKGE